MSATGTPGASGEKARVPVPFPDLDKQVMQEYYLILGTPKK
jgi:hypothetical protein